MSITLTPADLAARWNTTVGNLATARSAGRGCAYSKPLGKVVYLLEDVEAFERAARVETVESSAVAA